MIYAVSDLHGCYDRYRQLLDKLDLEEQDTLYVLGDALDRGPEGFQILSDMASRPQVVGLLGNHEAMALDALPGLLGRPGTRPRIHEPERTGRMRPSGSPTGANPLCGTSSGWTRGRDRRSGLTWLPCPCTGR